VVFERIPDGWQPEHDADGLHGVIGWPLANIHKGEEDET
jgi:hypothetical protein